MEEDIGVITGPFANEMRRLLAAYSERLGSVATTNVKFSDRWSVVLYPYQEPQSLEKRYGSGETLEEALVNAWRNVERYEGRRGAK